MNTLKNTTIRLLAVAVMLLTGIAIGTLVGLFSNFIYLILLFPLGMGLLGALVISKVLTVGKIRYFLAGITLAILMSFAIYGALHFTQYLMFRAEVKDLMVETMVEQGMEANPEIANVLVDYALEEETGSTGFGGYILYEAKIGISIGRAFSSSEFNLGPGLTWIYWLIELGIIAYLCISPVKDITRQPFCETCDKWYGKEKHLGGKPNANSAILTRLIEIKDYSGLGRELEKETNLPSVELYVRDCATCTTSASLLSLKRISQGAKGTLRYEPFLQIFISASDKARILMGMAERQ